ncbi:MAG: restriction endonuclease subunit S [Bacteroidales bacterium]|nr:restriction endonuclease subunit S [Bacteroidales bacterium]
MNEWKEYKFSDFVEINPSVKIPKGIPVSFVEMKDLDSSVRYCESSQKKELTGGSRFINGDTLFARITPCMENGKICQVRNLENGIGFGSTEFHILRGKEGVSDSNFVYYLSRWDEVRDHAEHNMEGSSGRQRVPKQAFDNLYLNLPPLETQRSIAAILSSLDDKIDLLHRENATLEQMAETLFRQWFVVEAKEEWEEKPLGKCIKLVGGGTPKTSEERFWNGNVCWLSGGDIANNHKNYVSSSEKSISEDGLNNSSAKLLPENAMVVSARGTVGKYCLLSKPMAFSQSNYGILPIYSSCYFFTYLLVAYHIDELQSAAYGSVFDTITTKTFEGVSVLLPKETGYIVEFEKMIEPYFSKMKYNNKQIQTLIQTRDGLLPRLMNNEIKL